MGRAGSKTGSLWKRGDVPFAANSPNHPEVRSMRLIRSQIVLAALAAVGFAALAAAPSTPAEDTKEPAKSPAPASRARPIPTVDFHIPFFGFKIFGMHAESNRPVLGRPTAPPSDLRYFYLPLLAFQKKGTGKLDVTVSEENP